jgi:hypothetical protein
MAKPTPKPVAESRSAMWWEALFSTAALVVFVAGVWYALQSSELQVLVLSLAVGVALFVIAMRPWRHVTDRGAVALWLVGALLLVVALVSAFDSAPLLIAGAGAGFVLGLAASRHVYPKPTP